MTKIKQNLTTIRSTLRENVELIAVSKYYPIESIEEAYACGQRCFGESREQELKIKHEKLPSDIEWHFIGHLQTNKVRSIVPYVAMIQTVDSMKLLVEIEKQAKRVNRCIDVLLELHIAKENTKSGFSLDECRQFLEEGCWKNMNHIKICGIMTMATNTDSVQQIKDDFTTASMFFEEIKNKYFKKELSFKIRSFGMSNDYIIAMETGTTMVRIGSAIFS